MSREQRINGRDAAVQFPEKQDELSTFMQLARGMNVCIMTLLESKYGVAVAESVQRGFDCLAIE